MTLYNLDCEELSVSVLPESGAAITQGIFQGKSFLAKSPYPSIEPKFLGVESDWLTSWNGGWQPLLPNVGVEYLVGKFPQGFHGNASQARWEVTRECPNSMCLDWIDENLHSQRLIDITENSINLSDSVVNFDEAPRSIIVTKHLVLGSEFLNSEIFIEPVGDARFRELQYDGSANGSEFEPWDNFKENSCSQVTSQTPARMGVFSEISCISVCNDLYEIEISWDAKSLPYLWIWEETATTKEHPWNGEYWALGIEPSSAPDGMGLGGGSIKVLQVDEKFDWSVKLKIQKRASK